MFDVEAIRRNADLRDLVEKAGGELDAHGRGACPIHGGDNSDAFHVYEKDGKQLWKCFSADCGGGDAFAFVQAWRGWSFVKACEFLGGNVQDDPAEMKRLADERMAKAALEHEEARLKVEAARKELQVAEKHLYYHETMGEWAKQAWTERGLDESWQRFYYLGACDDFVIGDGWHTPTLTIPIFDEERNVLNIKHRLINPQKPKDKYRPEKSGLGPFPPLLALPEMGYDGGTIIVVEGEIKAMVMWVRAENPDIQVIGVPGLSQFKSLSSRLFGKNVYVLPDPGGEKEAYEFAKSVNGSFLRLPDKPDDYVLKMNLHKDEIKALLKQARRV